LKKCRKKQAIEQEVEIAKGKILLFMYSYCDIEADVLEVAVQFFSNMRQTHNNEDIEESKKIRHIYYLCAPL
jgi:hypothetical protein